MDAARARLSYAAQALLDRLHQLDPEVDSIRPEEHTTSKDGVARVRGLLKELEDEGILWRRRGAPPQRDDGRAAGGARMNWGLLDPPDHPDHTRTARNQ